MICMLWTFCDFCKLCVFCFEMKETVTELDRKEHFKEIHALKQLFDPFYYELNASV